MEQITSPILESLVRKSLACKSIFIGVLVVYGCSNILKLFENDYIFKKIICIIFTKDLFCSAKIFFPDSALVIWSSN